MAEDRGTLREVSWQDVFPAVTLLSTVRLAVNFRVLVLAAVALALTFLGWAVLDRLFDEALSRTFPWQPALVVSGEADLDVGRWAVSPLVAAWQNLTDPFVALLDPETRLTTFAYLLLCALWALAIWAFFGGAITRFAAVALAREEQLSWGQLLGFARSKWVSYFTAPVFPLLGVVLAAIPLALVGLLLRFDVGIFIAALLWPLVLLAGLFMAILMVGLLFGWPLMWATISTEGTDSFDALSRCYSYVYQRPLRYLFYIVLAALLGLIGWILVSIFATAVVELSHWGVSWGSSSEELIRVVQGRELGSAAEAGSSLIRFWIGVVFTFATAFAYSFFWIAATAIYLLLRQSVDAMEMDEVYMPEEEEAYGLPPLETDAAGVPGVPDDPHGARPVDPGPPGAAAV